MPYDVYFTAEAETWMLALDDNDYDAIMARIELLEERGPGLSDLSSTASRAAATRT